MASDKRSTATIVGTVDSVGEVNRGTFTCRETIVVEQPGGKYPNPVVIEWSGDNRSKASDLLVGDKVTIACNVRGRRWVSDKGEVKHFLSLSGWKVEEHDKSGRVPLGGDGYSGPPAAGPNDDLPFAACGIEHEPTPIARAIRRGP